MKKPNFFIIGAPKCGTTSLAAWLASHPEVYVSATKEPRFFSPDIVPVRLSLSEYEALFSEASQKHKAVGEASVTYLRSSEAVPEILRYSPEARFIVCLRNPIEMVQSFHAQRFAAGVETVKDFERAWALQSVRRAGKHVPLMSMTKSYPNLFEYGWFCLLGEQMKQLYQIVPRHKVKAVLLHNMSINPEKEYKKIAEFLGVDVNHKPKFCVLNTSKTVRSKLIARMLRGGILLKKYLNIEHSFGTQRFIKKINFVPYNRLPLDPIMKRELIAYFEKDIEVLSMLIKQDLSSWILA